MAHFERKTKEEAEALEEAFQDLEQGYFTLESTDLHAFLQEQPLTAMDTFEKLAERAEALREAAEEYKEAVRQYERTYND